MVGGCSAPFGDETESWETKAADNDRFQCWSKSPTPLELLFFSHTAEERMLCSMYQVELSLNHFPNSAKTHLNHAIL